MSKTDSLHYQLCVEGAKWLRRAHHCSDNSCKNYKCYENQKKWYDCRYCYNSYKWVTVELVVNAAENADVWGYDGYRTAVIEVKVSHSDFLADKKKFWRNVEPEFRAGNIRWYLCPEGIIKPDELPENWGLLYWDGRRIYPVVNPKENLATGHADMIILNSILEREGFKHGIFNYRNRDNNV